MKHLHANNLNTLFGSEQLFLLILPRNKDVNTMCDLLDTIFIYIKSCPVNVSALFYAVFSFLFLSALLFYYLVSLSPFYTRTVTLNISRVAVCVNRNIGIFCHRDFIQPAVGLSSPGKLE